MNNALTQWMKDDCQANGLKERGGRGGGGAPLINEIKIFKHCFTILPVTQALSLCDMER